MSVSLCVCNSVKSKPIFVNRINIQESESNQRTNTLPNSFQPITSSYPIADKGDNSSTTMKEINSKTESLVPSLIKPALMSVSPKSPSKSAPPSPKWKVSTSNSASIPPSPKPLRQKRKKAKDISSESLDGNSVLQPPPTPTRRRKQKGESKTNSGSTDNLVSKESRKNCLNIKGLMREREATKSSNGHDSGHSTASVTPSSPPATPSSLPTTPTLLSRPSSPAAPLPRMTDSPSSEAPLALLLQDEDEAEVKTPLNDSSLHSLSPVESSVDNNTPPVEPTKSRPESPKFPVRPLSPTVSRPLSPPVSRPISPVLLRRRSSGALSSLSSRRSSLTASRYNLPSTSSYSTTHYSTPSTSYNYSSRYSSTPPKSSYASPYSSSSSYSSPSYSSSYASPSYSSPSYSSMGSVGTGTGYTSKYASSPTSSYYSSPSSRTSSVAKSSKSKDGCIVS